MKGNNRPLPCVPQVLLNTNSHHIVRGRSFLPACGILRRQNEAGHISAVGCFHLDCVTPRLTATQASARQNVRHFFRRHVTRNVVTFVVHRCEYGNVCTRHAMHARQHKKRTFEHFPFHCDSVNRMIYRDIQRDGSFFLTGFHKYVKQFIFVDDAVAHDM